TPMEEGSDDLTSRLSLDGGRFYKYDHYDHLNHPRPPSRPFAINLLGCRKFLTVRIVGAAKEEGGEGGKFNLWCMDGETEKEWQVQGRTWEEFKELRRKLTELRPSIGQVAFPKEVNGSTGLNLFGTRERMDLEGRRVGLEKFLRKISTLVYTSNLHPKSREIMHAMQEFLACGEQEFKVSDRSRSAALRRAVQCYTARVFLLPVLDILVAQFVAGVKGSLPTNAQIVNMCKQPERGSLKAATAEGLERVRGFLQQLFDVVSEGCKEDLKGISEREFYKGPEMNEERIEKIVKSGVRRQVEAEVYVPLRSILSRVTVNAYRREDVEMKKRVEGLKGQEQAFYNIPEQLRSPTRYGRASEILANGIGKSTLPKDKLDAIVSSAGAIVDIFKEEGLGGEGGPGDKSLGADDFLPIFINCVVNSGLDRMVSLCVLVNGLVDEGSKIGETGYYMATFEAAVEHIKVMVVGEGGECVFLREEEEEEGGGVGEEGGGGQDVDKLERMLATSGFMG
ncbi:hypothetical protein TrRE_jg6834, partial [Triparma retinervis]